MTTQTIQTGQPAPVFVLPDQDGNTVNLVDYRDQWVVLYSYPKDDTPGCTIEACEFTSDLGEFENLNANVLGISADTPEDHRRFIEKYKLGITLLSDTDKSVMMKYGVATDGGISRQTFIIDPRGKIAQHWPKVSPKGHAAEVRAKLAELQKG